LRAWSETHPQVRAAPAPLRDAAAPAEDPELRTLSALHHVLDRVVWCLHHGHEGVLDLQTFLSGIGLTPFVHPIFHPFFHEVHSVVAVNDPDEPPAIVDVLWPGAMFGQLLVLRSAVVVRAGRGWLDPAAGSSATYSAQARPGLDPDTHDLMLGDFGGASIWQPRRDYALDDAFVFNIDGEDDVSTLSTSAVGLTLEERRELVAHRCFVRGPHVGPFRRNVVPRVRLEPRTWSLRLERRTYPKTSRVAEEVARGSAWPRRGADHD
jgi:hypothetical protein